ncbi:hypothetical protein [Roseovarius sp. 2305UL8-3]|uniref:hypothetical protein n=1 Tax=Roseovarius conchicola TaxID=3121636 RepID=UPI0035281AFE
MHRFFAFLMAGLMLAACTNPNDLDKGPVYLGNFSLGHNVVVAPNLTKGPASRDATKEEWIESMKLAIDERFGPQDGDKLYHLGISVEGYVLAVTGVPIVAAPKSALILRVTVWDDAAGKKLNEEPEQITVIESFSTNTVLGSGLTQSKEKQMGNLSRNAAKLVQNWLVRENAKNGWFEADGKPRSAAEIAAEEETLKAKADADAALESADAETDEPAAAETPALTEETDDTTDTPVDQAADQELTPAEQAAAIEDVVVEPDIALAPATE